MNLLIATTNPHKLEEYASLLASSGVELAGLDETADAVPTPCEDGATFEDNARRKATAYAQATGRRCLADDSGLEVDALKGAPGVHSARYAAVQGPRPVRDRANIHKLLEELQALGDVSRDARLVCALCVADANGQVLFEARGTIDGVIIDTAQGDHGFGYDAHLYLPQLAKTMGQLEPAERDLHSHRAMATRALSQWLSSLRSDG